MTVAELMEFLKTQPSDRRVMVYDFEAHDQWFDAIVEVVDVEPVANGRAKYATIPWLLENKGETIVSIEL